MILPKTCVGAIAVISAKPLWRRRSIAGKRVAKANGADRSAPFVDQAIF